MKRICRDIGVVQNAGRCCNGGMTTLVVSNAFPIANPKTSKILTLSIEGYFLMTEVDNHTIDIQKIPVSAETFKHAASGIEFVLNELISEIALATTYTGDDAIVHAVKIIATAHELQSYLFAHWDELVRAKKMKTYEQNPN